MRPPRLKESQKRRDFAADLRQRDRKLTGPRRAILSLLQAQEHPLTARQLFARLLKGTCDLVTLYRSLHLLEELGLVKRFDFGDGIARYEWAGHREAMHHHHHLICRGCSTVIEIEDCFPADFEKKIASGNGFKAITHKLEFFGICPTCQTK